jgi:hypothetical protein
MATVFVLAAPAVSATTVRMDGRALGSVSRGSSFSIEVPAGPHRFVAVDGKHTYALDLEANRTYSFHIPAPGGLELEPPGTSGAIGERRDIGACERGVSAPVDYGGSDRRVKPVANVD